MIEIVVASKNAGKVAEFASVLADLPVKVRALSDFGNVTEAIEDGETFYANAVLKAEHYAKITGLPCLADDSGLEVDALGGAPGVYSARYSGDNATDEANNSKLLNELAKDEGSSRTARFRCALALVSPGRHMITAEGTCEGIIIDEPRGQGGFGYDPLFYVPEMGKTLAEMTMTEKNSISHRGQAIRNLAVKLAGNLK